MSTLLSDTHTIQDANMKTKVLLRLLLSSYLIGIAIAVCPEGYFDPGSHIGRCYRFVKTSLTWQAARTECVMDGGDLFSIQSQAEKTWFETEAKLIMDRAGSYWTGLIAPNKLGEWEWTDGTPYERKLINWKNGKPRDKYRCTDYDYRSVFKDSPCSARGKSICARTRDVPIACPAGWSFKNKQCYKYQDIERQYDEARLDCSYFGGDLVDIQTEEEQQFIHTLEQSNKRPAWIGLRSTMNMATKKPVITWVTGKPVDKPTYWAKNEPKIKSGEENNSCGHILASTDYGRSWAMDRCDNTRPYICKRPTGGCPPGWRLFQNHCIRIYTGKDNKAWSEANHFCQNQNAALLIIPSVQRQLFISRFLHVIKESGSTALWLGAKYERSSQKLMWVTGEEVSYTNWAPGQPVYDDNRDNCLQINTETANGSWEMNSNCFLSKAFACYIKTGKDIVKPTPAPPAQFSCPVDWKLFGAGCFFFGSEYKLGWIGARKKCETYNGDLVDIRDAATQVFINKHFTERSWIALNDRLSEGMHVWLDETVKANWTNWASGQPDDNGGRRKNCVYADREPRSGQWVDEACSMPLSYICKAPAAPIGIPPTPRPTPKGSRCGGPSWKERTGTDLCYRVVQQEVTWYDAHAACEGVGGHLTSITSREESEFIKDLVSDVGSAEVWIGLSGRNQGELYIWRWTDDAPFIFSNWSPGEQYNGDTRGQCVTMIRANGLWKLQKCAWANGYVCKRLVPGITTTLFPQTDKTPGPGARIGCPPGGIAFRGHCYFFEKDNKIWGSARDVCRKKGKGSDLVTISDQQEQDFVFSKAREFIYSGDGVFWIGMHRNEVNGLSWSDKSRITYTNWDVSEPRPKQCGGMSTKHGRWMFYDCSFPARGFVCRQSQQIFPATPTPTPLPGCPPAYTVAYRNACYRVVYENNTWNYANNFCFNQGGFLLDILDVGEQSFISSYLVTSSPEDYWIGMGKTTKGQWEWSSGRKTSYTNWDRHFRDEHTCAAIRSRQRRAGTWLDFPCNDKKPFVCKVGNKEKGTTISPSTVDPDVPCPPEWSDSIDGSCYKAFVPYIKKQMKTWHEARDFCRALGGDLASIHSDVANNVFSNAAGRSPRWIGLNYLNPDIGFAWSDGRTMEYTNWAPGQPDSHNNREQCVVFSRGTWSLSDCSVSRGFGCGLPKGTKPSSPPPTVTPAPSLECGIGWRRMDNWCYYFSPSLIHVKSWRGARGYCMQNGGDLASVDSIKENSFITSVISKTPAEAHVWIGLNKIDKNEYRWSDGSSVTFFNWDKDQPKNNDQSRQCVSFYTDSGFWRNDNCGEEFLYVCKKRPNTLTAKTTQPTSIVPGYCPNGGLGLGNKCFYVIHGGDVTSRTWEAADQACKVFGDRATLASVHSLSENNAINMLMETGNGAYWIGLTDRRKWRKWRWVDGSDFDFSTWAPGQPSGHIRGERRTPCVEMRDSQWYDQKCEQRRGYVCQLFKEPPIMASTPPSIDTDGCPDNTYIKARGNCYKIFTERKSWPEAHTTCMEDKGELSSVEGPRINTLLGVLNTNAGNQGKFWIGMQSLKTPGYYQWTDKTHVLFTNWAKRQPLPLKDGGCVAIGKDEEWYDLSCKALLPFACKYTLVPGPTPPPEIKGVCPSSAWKPYKSYCYYLNPGHVTNHESAQDACKKRYGAELTPIHDPDVNKLLVQYQQDLKVFRNSWIDMVQKDGKVRWADGSAVKYINWQPGEPAERGQCVRMDKGTGQWRALDCGVSLHYICRKLQDQQ